MADAPRDGLDREGGGSADETVQEGDRPAVRDTPDADDSVRPPWYDVFLNGDERRLRGGWRLVLGIVAFLAASILGAIVALLHPPAVFDVIPLVFTAQFWANVAMVGAFVGLAMLVDRRRPSGLGLGGPGWWPNLAFGLVLGLAMTTAVVAVELVAGLATIEGTFVTRPLGPSPETMSFLPALLVTVAVFVSVAVAEELFARGYLMTNLAEATNGLGPIGPRGAIAIAALATSALFGALHLGNPSATLVSTLMITLVGVYFAAAYVITGDLGVPIGVHLTWNLSLALYGLPVSGFQMPASVLAVEPTADATVTGGAFGPEAGLILLVALVVAVAATWLWVRWREGRVRFREDVATYEVREEPANHEG